MDNDELIKEIRELGKQIEELMGQIEQRGAPTNNEAKKLLQLWVEYQARCAMLHGMNQEEAYREARKNIWWLGLFVDERVVE